MKTLKWEVRKILKNRYKAIYLGFKSHIRPSCTWPVCKKPLWMELPWTNRTFSTFSRAQHGNGPSALEALHPRDWGPIMTYCPHSEVPSLWFRAWWICSECLWPSLCLMVLELWAAAVLQWANRRQGQQQCLYSLWLPQFKSLFRHTSAASCTYTHSRAAS